MCVVSLCAKFVGTWSFSFVPADSQGSISFTQRTWLEILFFCFYQSSETNVVQYKYRVYTVFGVNVLGHHDYFCS